MPNYKKPMMKKGMAYKKSMAYKESSKQEKTNLMDENPVADREKDTMAMKKGSMAKMYKSPSQMNKYDKDMMHERELIYDAKKEIHKEDVAKKKHMHVVSRIAGRNSR
jgi:hypothetical protein